MCGHSIQAPNNSGVLGAAPPDRLGTASGTLATMRQLGQVAGIAIASTVWATRQQAYLAVGLPGVVAQGAGFRDAFLVLAGAGLLAVVASALRGRGDSRESQPPAFTQDRSTAPRTPHAFHWKAPMAEREGVARQEGRPSSDGFDAL
jgi:hypothetical protein